MDYYAALKDIQKRRHKNARMEDLTLQQVHILQPIQEASYTNRATYLQLYRKIVRNIYTTDLIDLMHAEFDRVDVQLKVPTLPPHFTPQEEQKTLLQLDSIMQLYDSVEEVCALL